MPSKQVNGSEPGLWEAGAAVREAFFDNRVEAGSRAMSALELSRDREVEFGAAFALVFADNASQAGVLRGRFGKAIS